MSAMPATPIESAQIRAWSKFLILFASLWNWLAAWTTTERGAPLLSAEVFGAWLVYVLIFLGIAYAIKGRRKMRDWNSFARWYFWLSLIITCLAYNAARYEANRIAVLKPQHESGTADEQLKPSVEAERLRKAAAQQPSLSDSTVSYLAETPKNPTDAEIKRVLVQSLKEITQLRRESDSERERISHTLGKLFTVEAVDSPQVGSQVIRAVQEQVALDKRMSIATADWMEHTRVQFEKSKLPQGVKSQTWREFLAGLEENKEVFSSRVRALNIERTWADATIDFYTFTERNRDHIMIDGGRVRLDDETLLTDYNAKLTRAKSGWRQLQDAVREQMKIQEAIEKETGDPVEKLEALIDAK
jgi:hypothetical protein